MAAAVIGALRVVLGADTASFEDGLKGAESKLSGFGNTIAKGAAVVGTAVAAMGIAIGVAVKHSIDEADKLGKMSQSIGIPVEELSKLKFAADLSDVSLETLGKSVGRLSKAMVEAAAGGAGPATQAFKAMGVQVQNTDGTLRSSSDVLADVATKFKGYEDSAGKTALAIAIFGKAGAGMIPLLNQGADGLRSAKEEAEQLGIVIDTKTAKAAEDFNDNLKRLGAIKDGIITKITAGLVPALSQLSGAMVQAGKDSELMKSISDGIASAFKVTTEIGLTLVTVIQRISAEVNALVEAGKLLAAGQITAAFSTFRMAGEQTEAAIARLKEQIATMWDAPAQAVADKSEDNSGKIAAPLLAAEGKISEAAKRVRAEMAKFLKEGEKTFTDTRTAAELLEIKMQKLKDQVDGGVISWETYSRAVVKAGEDASNTWLQAGGSIASSFATISNSMSKENTKMAMTAKAFALAAAIFSAYEGAAKALTLPFPANLAAAAAVLAKGFAFVAAIQSQNIPSFAEGGSIRIKSPGGRDSVPLSMMVSPGEQVDVWKPGSGPDPRRGGGGGQMVINLHGENYSQKSVRNLINSLNEAIRGGARLVVT